MLSWARGSVSIHEKFTVNASFKGTVVLAGQVNRIEVVAKYVGYPTEHELQLLLQLIVCLPVFITDIPFVQLFTMSEQIGLMEILITSSALCYCFVLRNICAPHAAASLGLVVTLLVNHLAVKRR